MIQRTALASIFLIGLLSIWLVDQTYRIQVIREQDAFLTTALANVEILLADEAFRLGDEAENLGAFILASEIYPDAAALERFIVASGDRATPVTRYSILDGANIVQFDYVVDDGESLLLADINGRPAAAFIAAAHRLGQTVISDPMRGSGGNIVVHAFTPFQKSGRSAEVIMVTLPLLTALADIAPRTEPPLGLQLFDAEGSIVWSNGQAYEAVSRPLSIGGGEWTIAVGWNERPAPPPAGIAIIWGLGGLFVLLIVTTVYLEQSRSRRLTTAVAEQTAELRDVNQTLSTEVNRRKIGEANLQRERDRLSRIMATTPVGVLLLDQQGQINFANQRAQEILHLGPDKTRNYPFTLSDWVVTDDLDERAPSAPSFTSLVASDDHIHNARYSLVGSDDRRILLSVNSVPIRDESGQLSEVICAIEDVSDIALAERELRASEERYRMLVDQAVIGIMTTDETGRFEAVNPWAADLLGYQQTELQAIRIHDLLPESQRDDMAARWEELLQGATVMSERLLRRADGHLLPVDISARRLENGRFQIIIRDASDRHNAAVAQQRRRAQMEALRAIGLELAAQLDVTALLDLIIGHATELLHADGGCLYLYRPARDLLEAVVLYGSTAVPLGHTLKMGEGLSGQVWQTRQTMSVGNYGDWLGDQMSPVGNIGRSVVAAPIFWGDTFIGVINVAVDAENAFGDEEARLLNLFAAQAAIATQNARLYEAEQKARQYSEILRLANVSFSRTLDLSEVIGTLLDCLNHLIAYDRAGIVLQNSDGGWELRARREQSLKPMRGKRTVQLQVDDFPQLQRALHHTLRFDDVQVLEDWFSLPDQETGRSWLTVPLQARGESLGFCFAVADEPFAFPVDVVPLAESLGVQGAVAIQNTRLFDAEREQRLLAEALRSAAIAFNHSQTLDDVLTALLEHGAHVIPHDAGEIMLIDERNTARVVHVTGVKNRPSIATRYQIVALPVDQTPDLKKMAVEREACYIADTSTYADWVPYPGTRWIRSCIATPIHRNDDLIGFLHLYSARPNAFSLDQAGQLQAFVDQGSVALEKVLLYQDLQRYADELEARVAERTHDLTIANRRLQELDRLRSKLIDDISHSLRTPLANLHLYLDLLDHGPAHKNAHYLAVIKKQTERLAALVRGILELSQLSAEPDSVTAETVDFSEIVAEAVGKYRSQAEEAGLRLTLTPAQRLPAIPGDAFRLAKMVENIVANAVNYTGEGEIEVATSSENGLVTLQVKDTGLGIEDNDMPHIFDRFYRGLAAGERNISGIGLGLSIVSEIVALHEGEIEVVSQAQEGTTIRVHLPTA